MKRPTRDNLTLLFQCPRLSMCSYYYLEVWMDNMMVVEMTHALCDINGSVQDCKVVQPSSFKHSWRHNEKGVIDSEHGSFILSGVHFACTGNSIRSALSTNHCTSACLRSCAIARVPSKKVAWLKISAMEPPSQNSITSWSWCRK